ncbi:MAG: hypothetical protein AB7L09_21475 [Nitrospira sp.]
MPEPVVIEQNTSPAQLVEARAVSRIKAKILHVLSVYPRLNHSMLQVGIGPSIAPDIWRPVLLMLIDAGYVKYESIETTGPTGRSQQAGILSLTDTAIEWLATAQAQPQSQGNTNTTAQANGEAQSSPDLSHRG